MNCRKKLIDVVLPLNRINEAAGREISIRNGAKASLGGGTTGKPSEREMRDVC